MSTDWSRWSSDLPPVSGRFRRTLEAAIGPLPPERLPVALDQARVAPSAVDAATVARLAAVVAPGSLHVDDETRARHAGGHAYADLVRRRAGDASQAPDAVAFPADESGVGRLLQACVDLDLAVVPWGGGTSVVGGLAPLSGGHRATVAVDLSRLTGLVELDAVSRLATFRAGTSGPDAEAALSAHGLTLGHFPQSYERATLGGYAVTRSAGQASTGYGRFDDLVAGLRVQTPVGALALPPVAGSAAGPDLRRLFLGSEGTLGIVTEVTLRVRRAPEVVADEGWMLPDWQAGLDAFRAIAQDGPRPDIARLSDADETRVALAASGTGRIGRRALAAYLRARKVTGGCLVIVGFEGTAGDVRHRRDGVRRQLRAAGGVPLGRRAGASWRRGRYAGPRQRDALLDLGVLAETLETAATWSQLPDLYAEVRGALESALPHCLIGCHVSHVYGAGASLYFTVLARAESGDEPSRAVAQWAAAKQAANDAIVRAGGTITHHHAVGTAHRDHVAAELGDVGVRMLEAVQRSVDPERTLNPEKLLPPG